MIESDVVFEMPFDICVIRQVFRLRCSHMRWGKTLGRPLYQHCACWNPRSKLLPGFRPRIWREWPKRVMRLTGIGLPQLPYHRLYIWAGLLVPVELCASVQRHQPLPPVQPI